MKKWTGKAKQAGGCLCLAALLLAGCGDAKTTQSEEKAEAGKQTETSKLPEKSETEPVENPAFIQDGIRKVVLTEDGEEIFHLSKEPANYKMDFDYWEILNPYDETMTVNTEEMYGLFDILCQMNLQTPIEIEAGIDTGIEDSSTSIFLEFVNTQDEEKAKSTLYADAEAEIILGNEAGEGNRFAAVKGFENQVYKLPTVLLESVYELNPYDYILKIPVLVNIETVESIELSMSDKTYEMSVDAQKQEYQLGKKKVEKEDFTTLYQALSSVMLAGQPEEERLKETNQALLTVTYNRNQDTAPQISVSYYEYDDTYALVKINDTQSFLVKKADVETLIKQIVEAF